MIALLFSVLILLLAIPALAADAGKPATTQIQGQPAPPVQSDAVKPLTQPNIVTPPANKPVGPTTAPKVAPPAPTGGPSVSGPKPGPGAPGAGPSVPAVPAAGAPGIDPKLGSTIRDANQLDAIRDLKQLEQLYDPMHRGPGAAGSQGGLPRTLGTGRLGEPSDHQGPQGLGRDCLANPQGPGCIGGAEEDRLGRGQREGSGLGQSHDRFGAPPTLRGTLGNPGGAASGDGNAGGAVGSTGAAVNPNSEEPQQNFDRAVSKIGHPIVERGTGPGTREEIYSDGRVESSWDTHGRAASSVTVRDSAGNEIYYRDTYVTSDGDTVVYERIEGRAVVNTRIDSAGRVDVSKGRWHPPSATQPSEAPTGGAGNDGCNWAPIHGCLNPREDIRTTIRQQTTQPGINPDGQSTEGGTGSSRGGSTGPEAVTNTGDGSFGVQRSGNSGTGTPIWQTLPDPARGGPGGPAPGSPVRRAGSDAGIDAGTGALPVPPPPPR